MADSMLENGVVYFDEKQPPKPVTELGDSMLENGVVPTPQPMPVKVTEPIPEQPGIVSRTLSGIGEAFTGSERTTPEVEGMKELVGSDIRPKETSSEFALASALMFGNEKDQIDIVKKVIPGATVEPDEKGNMIVVTPDGDKAVLNKPGFSFQDFYNLMGTLNLYSPAGKVPGMVGKGLGKKVAASAIAEGGTEYAKQKAMQALGSEQETDIGEIGIAGVTGGMTTAAGPLIKGFKQARQAKKLGVLAEETKGLKGAVEEGVEASKATGVELFPAQVTLSPSAGRKQAALQMLDGSSLKAIEALKKQDAQVGKAVEDTLSFIAPAKTIDEAPEMVVKAAEKKLSSLKKSRTAAAKPLYEKALSDKGLYDVPKTRELIDEGLEGISPKSPLAAKLKKIKGFLEISGRAEVIAKNADDFKTGTPVKFSYIKNTEKAPKMAGMQQGIEPSGRYINMDTSPEVKPFPGWEKGEVSFKNPLVVPLNTNPGEVYTKTSWKNNLTKKYGGKKGKALSEAIKKDGYDGIVTIDLEDKTVSEIVDLSVKQKSAQLEGIPLTQLDRAYKDLGDMIESAKRKGDAGLSRELSIIKDTYVKEIENITPDYKKAVKTWERMSKPIDKYLKSVPGKISQLDPADQAKLDSIATSIFKPRTTTAQVKQIKRVIQKESPEAWAAITRRRFEDLLAKGGYDNPNKVITALFSDKSKSKQLYAALDTEAAKRLRFLEVAAERSKKGRFGGPDSAFKMEDIKDVDRGAWAAIGGLFTPFETLKGALSGVSKEQRRSVLADAVFNTKWSPDWVSLRKLDPNSKAAKNKMMQIITKSARELGKPAAQAVRAKTTEE